MHAVRNRACAAAVCVHCPKIHLTAMTCGRLSPMAFDYSKWDNIELSDDDDESCHPNIDKNLWRRIKKRDRDERDAKIAAEKEQLSKEVEVTKFEMAQLTKQLEETGVDASAVK